MSLKRSASVRSGLLNNNSSTTLNLWKPGVPFRDVCCEAGIYEVSYYNRKANLGGMKVYDIKKMKDLEDENHHLQQMFN